MPCVESTNIQKGFSERTIYRGVREDKGDEKHSKAPRGWPQWGVIGTLSPEGVG